MIERFCETFRGLIGDLEQEAGVSFADAGERDSWTVPFRQGMMQLHLSLREATGYVLVYADAGPFGPSRARCERARMLLEMNGDAKLWRGRTFAVDAGLGRLVLQDRFPVERFESAAALAGYLNESFLMLGTARRALQDFEEAVAVMRPAGDEDGEEDVDA